MGGIKQQKFPILVNSRKKPFPPILHTNEVIPKAQSGIEKMQTPAIS
jgi:hypothetical protein